VEEAQRRDRRSWRSPEGRAVSSSTFGWPQALGTWHAALESLAYRPAGPAERRQARTWPDHYPVPWAVSRTSDPDGIRVHCPAHNSLTAREYFGEAFIHAKVAEARAKRHEARGEAGGRAREAERRSAGGG
jgi:hypothetical protein